MSDQKITQLPEKTSIANSDYVPIVDESGTPTTKKITANNLFLGKGQTLFIASSTSTASQQLVADYICDGTSDDVQIQAAINALSSGGKILLSQGVFSISATIALISNLVIEGQGKATELVQTSANQNNDVLFKDTVSNLRISNLWIHGTGAGTGNGIDIANGSLIHLDNCIIDAMGAKGIRFYTNDKSSIQNCTSFNNVGNGIYFTICTNSDISSNRIYGNATEGIFLDTNNTNNNIENNFIDNNGSANCVNIALYNGSSNNTVLNNQITNATSQQGLELSTASNFNTITGNIITGSLWDGLHLYNVSNNTFIGNQIFSNGKNGVYFNGSGSSNGANYYNIVKGNIIYNNSTSTHLSYNGIDFVNLGAGTSNTNNLVEGNIIYGTNQAYGVFFEANNIGNNILNNELTGNGTDEYQDNGTNNIVGFYKYGFSTATLNFAGSGQYVSIANAADFQSSTAVTIEMWIRPTNTTQSDFNYPFSMGQPNMIEQSGSDQINYKWWTEIDTHDHTSATFGGTVDLTPNAWHHIVCTYDSTTHKKRVYIDSVMKIDETITGETAYLLTDQTGDLWIASRSGQTPGRDFLGKYSDFRYYKNVALTQAQVIQRYKQGVRIGGEKIIWKFQEESGTTVLDSSGNSHNGTITGSALYGVSSFKKPLTISP